jgi:DnaJ-class molecular chaperone
MKSFKQLWDFVYTEAISKHCAELRLEYPFTQESLKKAHQTRALETHSDRDGGSHEAFLKVQEAYEYLQDFVQEEVTEEDRQKAAWSRVEIEKQEPFKNFVDCPVCHGQGRWIEKIHETIRYKTVSTFCSRCGGDGKYKLPCRFCKGTGKYVQKSGREVPCQRCGGTSKFVAGDCRGCSGTGTKYFEIPVHDPREVTYQRECYACNGTGKKEILNPVLKKGVVTVGSKSRRKTKIFS